MESNIQATDSKNVGDPSSEVRIQPDELRRFAERLTDQASKLRNRTDDLDVIKHINGDVRLMGEFTEAYSLTEMSQFAVTVVDDLISQIREVVEFADGVAQETAAKFDQADADSKTNFETINAELYAVTERLPQ